MSWCAVCWTDHKCPNEFNKVFFYRFVSLLTGRLWLHVRSAGHWTKKLYEHFENYDPGETEDLDDDHCPMDDIERRRKSAVGSRRKSTIGMYKWEKNWLITLCSIPFPAIIYVVAVSSN